MIICLGAGLNQIPLIQASKELGYKVVAIDKNQNAVGFNLVDEKIYLSTYDEVNVIKRLKELSDKYNFKGIVARVSTPALNTASLIAVTFNIPGISSELLPIAMRKSKLREFCHKHSFAFPKGERVSAESFDSHFNFPLVVKPDVTITGKKSIRIVDNESRFNEYIKDASESSANGFAEIEEFIEGIDIEVMFFANNGKAEIIAIWDELVGIKEDDSILGIGLSIPSIIVNTKIGNKIIDTVNEFCSYFKNLTSMLTLCFRLDKNMRLYFIELHADLGGDLVADLLLPKSCKEFNYFEMVVDLSVGNQVDAGDYTFKPLALIYNDKCNITSNEKVTIIDEGDIISNHNKVKELVNVQLKQFPEHLYLNQIINEA